MLKHVKIRTYEAGFYFHDGEFRELLEYNGNRPVPIRPDPTRPPYDPRHP